MSLTINDFISDLSDKKGSNITFDELKNELLKKDEDGKQIYHINIKEDDNLAMIFYNTVHDNFTKLEESLRSYIIEKTTLDPIASQFNKIIYNDDAVNFIKNKNWNNVVVQPCYEGTMLLVFNYNDKWYVTTRRCLDSNKSKWIKNKSYRQLFDDAMEGKFTFDDLDKNLCYHFVLVHYKNKNIVTYSGLGEEYKELYHVMTTKKISRMA